MCRAAVPGTDDSELTTHLAVALATSDPALGFPLDAAATGYRNWYLSEPFDCGNTCRAAFSCDTPAAAAASLGSIMMQAAATYGTGSEANGALMRCTPIAIWSATLRTPVIALNAKLDAMLSHPSQVCQDCNVLYSLAIAHLVTHPGDHRGAAEAADAYAEQHVTSAAGRWLLIDSKHERHKDLACDTNIGHVRWAFTLAFFFLRNACDYRTAILETLMHGGDTDTNACIVGGLLGALHGAEAVPSDMKDPVIAFRGSDPAVQEQTPGQQRRGRRRPEVYDTSCEQLARDLLRWH